MNIIEIKIIEYVFIYMYTSLRSVSLWICKPFFLESLLVVSYAARWSKDVRTNPGLQGQHFFSDGCGGCSGNPSFFALWIYSLNSSEGLVFIP